MQVSQKSSCGQNFLYIDRYLFALSFAVVLQAELSGDQAAVQVLEAAEAQVADELNVELEKLAEKQIEEQAALEVKQVEELINMEEELRAEEQTAGQQVADQIEEQKQKVGNKLNQSLSLSPKLLTFAFGPLTSDLCPSSVSCAPTLFTGIVLNIVFQIINSLNSNKYSFAKVAGFFIEGCLIIAINTCFPLLVNRSKEGDI